MAARGEDTKPKKWQFTFDGEVYRESELTIAQCEDVEDMLGLSWLQINPVRSAKQARGLLSVLHSDRTGKPRDEVFAAVGKLTAEAFTVDVLKLVDDDLPELYGDGMPNPDGFPSTAAVRSIGTSSASRGRRSAGGRAKSAPNDSAISN